MKRFLQRCVTRVALTLPVALLLVAAPHAVAGPAADSDVITFRADANVGPVDNAGSAGDGLYLADPTGTQYPNQRRGAWSFSAQGPTTTSCVSLRALDGAPVQRTCSIVVDGGEITPVAGIGAACGMSHGRNGSGTFTRYYVGGGTEVYDLSDIAWTASAGGLIPVQGTYERNGDSTVASMKADDRRVGPLVGVAALQPMESCIDASGSGAENFTVVGVVAFL